MMNEYQMKLEEGNKVTLPESLVNKLLLRKGETVCLIQEDGIKDKCFKVTAENEKELFDEDFYCIPKRVFDMCHLDYESIQIIVDYQSTVCVELFRKRYDYLSFKAKCGFRIICKGSCRFIK